MQERLLFIFYNNRFQSGGSCDHIWYTYELSDDVMQRLTPAIFDAVLEV